MPSSDETGALRHLGVGNLQKSPLFTALEPLSLCTVFSSVVARYPQWAGLKNEENYSSFKSKRVNFTFFLILQPFVCSGSVPLVPLCLAVQVVGTKLALLRYLSTTTA